MRKAGRLPMLVAALLLLPELAYDMFQHVIFVHCLAGFLRKSRQAWVAT